MAIQTGSPAQVAWTVADFLERRGITYALGGAFASTEHTAFRETLEERVRVWDRYVKVLPGH